MKTIVSKSENTEYLKYIAGVKCIQLVKVGHSKNFFKIFKGIIIICEDLSRV